MTDNTNPMADDDIAASASAAVTEIDEENAKRYTKKDLEHAIKKRLKENAGTKHKQAAAPEEPQGPDMSEYVHVSQVPEILQANAEQAKLINKAASVEERVKAAAAEDQELKTLMQSGNELNRTDVIALSQMDMLPNIVAVAKELLKDKEAYTVFKSAKDAFQRNEFLRSLSKELDNKRMTKGAGTEYKPAPDIGSSAGDDVEGAAINKWIKRS
jgi:hypothetical protein